MNVVKQQQEQIKNAKQAAKSLAQALLLSTDTHVMIQLQSNHLHHHQEQNINNCIRKAISTVNEWTGGATTPHPSMLRLIRIAAVLAAARPTLLFRPL